MLKTSKIDGSGASQVKKHESSMLRASRSKTNQRTFINDRGTVSISKNKITYLGERKVVKAEILKALKVVACDYSFRSVNKDSLIYKEMFPDSKIAASFSQQELRTTFNMVLCLILKSHWLRIFVIVHLLSNLTRQPLSKWKNNMMDMFSISQNMAKS